MPSHLLWCGRAVVGFFFASMVSCFAHAAAPPVEDKTSAAARYATDCAACHGALGRGNVLVDGPVLAGLRASYIEAQLAAFRAGFRGASEHDLEGMEMRPAALALGEADAAALAAWLAQQPAPMPEAIQGDSARGRTLYTPCAACHGEQGEGNPTLAAPALAKQAPWYNDRQLRRFIAGVRGAYPDDTWGTTMRVGVTDVAPEDVPDIVAWLSELGRGATATR